MRTTAIFKCVVTLKNGFHKIVRLQYYAIAQMAAAVKQLREMPWLTGRYNDFFCEIDIDPNEFKSCKCINERTGEELITLAV